MSPDRGFSLPVAAFSVVALFLSTAFLGPHVFDLLRVGEIDTAKRAQLSQPLVESRLWEDPFAALARYRTKLRELCAPVVGTHGTLHFGPSCPRGVRDIEKKISTTGRAEERVTVIAAMLPGAAFIGVEEARRRVRYAVLAGLKAEGYVPEDSEHMRVLRVQLCNDFEGCAPQGRGPAPTIVAATDSPAASFQHLVPRPPAPPETDILYEALATPNDKTGLRQRAVVLWIDDSTVMPFWLRTLAVLLKDVAPEGSTLRILGPYRSDDLVKGLDDLANLLEDLKTPPRPVTTDPKPLWQARLSELRLISPFATAAAGRIRDAARPFAASTYCHWRQTDRDCVDEAFKDRLAQLGTGPPTGSRFFVRTVGSDRGLIGLLLRELCARGVASGGRILLLSEWDSIYARSFADTLDERLGEKETMCKFTPDGARVRWDAALKDTAPNDPTLKVESYYYLRGLDGANIDGAGKEVRLAPRGAKSSKGNDKEPAIVEWPESRDQRDYVRRLVARLREGIKWNNPETEVRAIGIIGNDVHDKLVLAQALRAAFPDRVLFTTDLDARLMHPDVTHYTRNLIVASSLPLSLVDKDKGTIAGPFRDIYQTATYLGARYAATAFEPNRRDAINEELAQRRLYEIGRDGEIELSIDKVPDHEASHRRGFALLTGALLVAFGGFMLFGQPTPSMKAALARGGDVSSGFDLATAILSGLQIAALGFALGVTLELGMPGAIGPARALLMTSGFTLCFWAFVYPGVRHFSAGQRGVDRATMRAWRLWQSVILLLLIGLVAGLAWTLWLVPIPRGMREPFALLSGVSAWPAELLRTLALLLFVWFLDYAWTEGRRAARRVGEDYFPEPPSAAVVEPAIDLRQRLLAAIARRRIVMRRRLRLLRGAPRVFMHAALRHTRRGLSQASIWFWSPPVTRRDRRVDGRRLWRNYRGLLRNGPRFFRILLWLAVAGVLVLMTDYLIQDAQPEIPARGPDDRNLFWGTMLAAAFATIVLLVLVGDATFLTFRFILLLKGGRTSYPRCTVERFAAQLGTDCKLQAVAAERITARISDRDKAGVVPRNSLLDDWIDAHLLADHTAAIGPLIVAPFILVALLVVARSALFDNWSIGGAVLVGFVGYLLWAIAMAALLNIGAEMARRKAIEGMQRDLMWLEGSGEKYAALAGRFPSLIEQVRTLRRGAFAPFFEQPLVQAILVPLGGAGGIQLLELMVFARS